MQSSAKVRIGAVEAKRAAKASDAVASVSRDLEHVRLGQNVAWALSSAMDTVDNHFREQTLEPLSAVDRDQLLVAISGAEAAASVYLPASYNRAQITAGMEAMAAQVMVWAESPARTAQRPRHFLPDTCAYARMFRNDLHNMSMLDEIEHRAFERRQATVDELLTGARRSANGSN